MNTALWFDDLPVLGKLPSAEAAAKLYEMGDNGAAEILESVEQEELETYGVRSFLGDKPWQHTAHTLGYLAPAPPNSRDLPILSASNIAPDFTLKSDRIKITLNALRVAAYPGSGTHQILFDFYAQNQLPDVTEHLHFNSTYRVREGERAALLNYPVFLGLNIGNDGLVFKCYTVNVKNEEDEAAIKFLDSDAFKTGLKLATTVQPAIKPLSEMAIGLTKAIANRRKNVAVQDIQIGLDFSHNPMGARLAEGVYIAVQVPETLTRVWDWSDWIYDTSTGQIVKDYGRDQLIPYNYIAFGISRYEGT
ncbi:MAG: hypothetical protein KME27_11090 [Lyngbya sp. HA4199-MV5]|jgi:hypothetical protein|nr:hypothetical protein [Lyngbya sp. HA4199-MV5]